MIKTLYPQFQKWCEKGGVYIISDTHFDDIDCKLMDPKWITPEEHMANLAGIGKNDTLIHLGDVGDPTYLDRLKCHKVLITGNHDILSKLESHFDEIYEGPLFIADRLLLSHEPIFGLERMCINIHGHVHNDWEWPKWAHICLSSNLVNYKPFNLGKEIKKGILSNTKNYHRLTIDKATENRHEHY